MAVISGAQSWNEIEAYVELRLIRLTGYSLPLIPNNLLFLTLEKAGLGSKWVISNVYDTELHNLNPEKNSPKFRLTAHKMNLMNR